MQNDPEVSRLRLYEFRGEDMREVFGVFENISNSLAIGFEQRMSVAIGDWDLDGDLDLLIASTKDRKLHYHENGFWSFPERASAPSVFEHSIEHHISALIHLIPPEIMPSFNG